MARKDNFVSGQVGPGVDPNAPIWNYPNSEVLSEDKREVVIPVMMEPAQGNSPAKWTNRVRMEQDKPRERFSRIGDIGNVRIMMRHPQSRVLLIGNHHILKRSLPNTASLEVDSPEAKALQVAGQEAKERFNEEFAPLAMARRARKAAGPRKKVPLDAKPHVSGVKPPDKEKPKQEVAKKKPAPKKKK